MVGTEKVPPDYEGLMMGVGDLLQNPGALEGVVLIATPLDKDDFASFTKKMVGDLLNESKRL